MQLKKEKLTPHVRWMIRRDMPEVLAIESASFEYAWNEQDFLKCLRLRNCIGMVAECKETGRIIGYMIYGLEKDRLEILNFATHPEYRNRGVGSTMVSKLKSKLSSHRRTRIEGYVRSVNLDAWLFFKSQGFCWAKTMPEFYEDSGDDAYLLRYEFEGPIIPANRLAEFFED